MDVLAIVMSIFALGGIKFGLLYFQPSSRLGNVFDILHESPSFRAKLTPGEGAGPALANPAPGFPPGRQQPSRIAVGRWRRKCVHSVVSC
jgi:hypothetical protein